MAINKVEYGDQTLMDLTEDTVTEDKVLEGETFHDRSGNSRVGSLVIPVQDVEVNGESVVNSEKVAEINIPTTDIQTAVDEFETYNGGILSSLKVSLTPNQDLHGYDHPWVGGAGKNKLPIILSNIKSINTSGTWSGNAYTLNGITYEVQTDSDDNVIGVKVTGTASANTDLLLVNKSTGISANTDYIMSGCASGGSETTYKFYANFYYDGSNHVFNEYGTGKTARWDNLPDNWTGGITIRIISGYSFSTGGLMFYPMIRLATESDPTFEPYSNICPISGHTQVMVGDDGKNLFDWTNRPSFVGFIDTNSQTFRLNPNYICTYIKCKPNTTYTISKEAGKTFRIATSVQAPADGVSYIGTSANHTGTSITYTTESNAEYLSILYWSSTNGDTKTADELAQTIQIELGSTATPYVPYNGYQVTVNLGGTYYSGTLGVVTGVFTPDKKGINLSDIGWSGSNGAFYSTNPISDIKHGGGRYDYAISSGYKTANKSSLSQLTDGEISVDASGYLQIKDNQYTTSASFVSDRGSIQIVYELATPTPIQLSPITVKALVGENHLSAPLEGQEITESKYKKMFTFDDVIAYIQSLS